MVEAVITDGAHEGLGERIGTRRTNGGPDRLYADRREHLIEAPCEVGITVAQKEAKASVRVFDVGGEVTRHLGLPWTVRVPGDAEDVHDTTVDLDDEEYVVAPKQDTDDMEEVSRDDALGLGTKELRPGRADTPRGGWHAVTTYHARHGCLRHRDAELLQFADDAEIAPAGVLLCQAADQLYGIVGKRRA